MAERRGSKRTYIEISSSSSGDDDDVEEEEEEDDDDQSESEKYDGNDHDECFEISASSISCDDEDEDDDDEIGRDDEDDASDDDKDEESADAGDEESRCKSVIRLLRERRDLQELNLKDCRAYLRKHGLRITGTKVDCIQRILVHWRRCLQRRYCFVHAESIQEIEELSLNRFDKVTRSGTSIGKRTVAGRVVKESYGAAKQQHTFTVEVLWSKGMKKMPTLFPLLVKGRNLYKLKTFRQRWKNETERHKVLAEKHKRGAAARLLRAKMKSKKACPKNGVVKRQKRFHGKGKSVELEKGKRAKGCGKAPMENGKSSNHHRRAPAVARANLNNSYSSKSAGNHQNRPCHNRFGDLTTRTDIFPPQIFHQPHMPFHHRRWSSTLQFPPTGSTSSRMGFPHFRPYVDTSFVPLSQRQVSNPGFYPDHAYSHLSRVYEPRNLNPPPGMMHIYRPLNTSGQRK